MKRSIYEYLPAGRVAAAHESKQHSTDSTNRRETVGAQSPRKDRDWLRRLCERRRSDLGLIQLAENVPARENEAASPALREACRQSHQGTMSNRQPLLRVPGAKSWRR